MPAKATPAAQAPAPAQPATEEQSQQQQQIFKTGKVVILLQGRYAGKKAIVVKVFDSGKDRPYSHALVAGIEKYPRRPKKSDAPELLAKKSIVKTFVRIVNLSHLMPTRYGVDLDLQSAVSKKTATDPTQRTAVKKELKQLFETRYLTGKNRWFFTPLKF